MYDTARVVKRNREPSEIACRAPRLYHERLRAVVMRDDRRVWTFRMRMITENAVGVASDDDVDGRHGAGKRLIGFVPHMRNRNDVLDARFFKFRRGTLKRLGTVGKIRVGAGFGNILSFVVGHTDDADFDAVEVFHDG